MKHPDYNSAEDDDPNKENSAFKYKDNHSIPSNVLCSHILHSDVIQHRGLESEEGDIVLSSISETINNNAADTEDDFKDLNKDLSPPQDLPNQSDIAALDTQLRVDGQVPTKQAKRMNMWYSGMFWEKHWE